jgi:hypothetical protein
MHAADQGKAFVVDGVTLQHSPEKIIGGAEGVVGFVYRWVTAGRLAFQAYWLARQLHGVLRIMHAALGMASLAGLGQLGGYGWMNGWARVVAQVVHVGQGAEGAGTLLLGAMGDDAVENVRRDETVEGARVDHQKILI